MLKKETQINLNIFKMNNADIGINLENNISNEQNIEYLNNIAFQLEKLILDMTNNSNIKISISRLKEIVIDIYNCHRYLQNH